MIHIAGDNNVVVNQPYRSLWLWRFKAGQEKSRTVFGAAFSEFRTAPTQASRAAAPVYYGVRGHFVFEFICLLLPFLDVNLFI